MEVIPFTLAISLLLSLGFIALFVREFSRPRRVGAEHDSLLPLEPDRVAPTQVRTPAHTHDHPGHAADEVCASKRTDGKCCSSCQRRKDKATTRAADGPKS
ncbi:MAG: hypothetical protein H7067_03205 [Burkholderiales bacterium]|nr:hypothetical protein [Opitutaceae bacterium]